MIKKLSNWFKRKFLSHLLEKDDLLINDVIDSRVDSMLMKERDFVDVRVLGNLLKTKSELSLLGSDGSYIEHLQMLNNIDNLKLNQKANNANIKNINETLLFDWGGSFTDSSTCPTEDEVIFYQDVMSKKFRFSPTIRNAVSAIKFYTAGKGAVVECPPKKNIDRIIQDVLYDNDFDNVHKDWIADTYLDAEIYLCFYFSGDKIWIEDFDPRSITEIKRHPKNERFELGYKRDSGNKSVWYQSVEYYFKEFDRVGRVTFGEKVNRNKAILHIKYGNHRSKRGVPAMEPILKWDRIKDELNLDLARFVHERARIPWIKKVKSGKVSDYLPERTNDRVRGSATKIETANVEWRAEDIHMNQVNWKFWARPFNLAISSGLLIPEFILFMDGSTGNYSNFKKADSPFVQLILNEQDFWAGKLRRICQIIVKYYHSRGKIEDYFQIDPIHLTSVQEHLVNTLFLLNNNHSIQSITEGMEVEVKKSKKVKIPYYRLPFSVTFPSPNPENMLLLSQAIQILVSIGVMSRKTASRLVGLDPKNEDYNMDKDNLHTDGDLSNPNPRMKSPRDNSPDLANRSANDFDAKIGR